MLSLTIMPKDKKRYTTKNCPGCEKQVPRLTSVCPYCGHRWPRISKGMPIEQLNHARSLLERAINDRFQGDRAETVRAMKGQKNTMSGQGVYEFLGGGGLGQKTKLALAELLGITPDELIGLRTSPLPEDVYVERAKAISAARSLGYLERAVTEVAKIEAVEGLEHYPAKLWFERIQSREREILSLGQSAGKPGIPADIEPPVRVRQTRKKAK